MGPRYVMIASYLEKGPAWLRIDLGDELVANFVVSTISPPSPAPYNAPFSTFTLDGPNGNQAILSEEEIVQVQPNGPQDGNYLHITLDNGVLVTLIRDI
jgi:hypothetical protein